MKLFEVDETILMYAFRHALTKPLKTAERVGYALRFYWKDLSDEFKDQVRREIRVLIERGEIPGTNEIVFWDNISQL